MAGIDGLQQEIDEIQGSILAIECILRALRRLPEGTTWAGLEGEVFSNALLIRKARSQSCSPLKLQAFERELARLLGLLSRTKV